MYRCEEKSYPWKSKKNDERLQIDQKIGEEVQEKEKAGGRKGLYKKEERTIQAVSYYQEL